MRPWMQYWPSTALDFRHAIRRENSNSAPQRGGDQLGDNHVGVPPVAAAEELHRGAGGAHERPQDPAHLNAENYENFRRLPPRATICRRVSR